MTGAYVSVIATGRSLHTPRAENGQLRSSLPGDVLSPVAQQSCGFAVGKLPDFETLSDNPVAEALHDNTKSPPDEAVCFKLDFTAWLTSLTE